MARKGTVGWPRRGELYLVSSAPTVGAEIGKTRPALIIQTDYANRTSPITIVAAISSRFDTPLCPTEVLIQPPEAGLKTPSVALLNQIRSIDRRRLVKRLGKLRPESMRRVNQAIELSMGLAGL